VNVFDEPWNEDAQHLAYVIVAEVRTLRAKWRKTSCRGDASDAEHGYVGGVHAVLDDLERNIGRSILEVLDEATP
jgi:hypothetical protein